MANKMLIDASHPEETRVVVLRGNRVEEFDFESASKKQLRGNIYLAKVTRVEPSLQAAFVEYGGNRHGFLAFSEIHPDYYQIPHADRAALLEEELLAHREEEEEEQTRRRSRRNRRGAERRRNGDDDKLTGEFLADDAAPQDQPTSFDEPAPDFVADQFAAPVDVAPAPAGEFFQAPAGEGFQAPAGETVDAPAAEIIDAPVEAPSFEEGAAPFESEPQFDAAPAFALAEPASEAQDSVIEASAVETPVVDASLEPVAEGETLDEDARAGDFLHLAQTDAPESDLAVDAAAQDGDDADDRDHDEKDHDEKDEHDEDEIVEQLGGDAMDETPYRGPRLRRQYKIQEVIKRRQVLLIQVVKEERGNKGAALTTYLSLAGRYSVLMPNTARGGGISRKITEVADRKRLKEIAGELDVPEGMGVILRTAGAARTKQEIERDFEYLMRTWEQVRELTLTSSAPALVYEEGSLIKRAIRDLYNKEIDEVTVAGEAGYREARDFMRLLMPSHVRNVQYYRDPQPIFAKWGAESQLDALFHNQVTLRSGGYLVINQTEALVAIDVNSGRSTREHNIEDTALRTNLEAAEEVARQLRLRDLAGLIVVDFIDMEESRNNRAVERKIKEALKDDRARIQVGRISHFGLLEMSRQRIRTGVLEGSSVLCPHCAGAGMVRSTASIAVHVMRVLEDALIKNNSHNVILRARTDIALYVLNHKRALLRLIEERFGVQVTVLADEDLIGGVYHALERGEPATGPSDPIRRFDPRQPIEEIDPIGEAEIEAEFEEEAEVDAEAAQADDGQAEGDDSEDRGEGEQRRRRRRRRGRGRNAEREGGAIEADAPQPSDEGLETMATIAGDFSAPAESEAGDESEASTEDGEPRRRGGRGQWRRRGRNRTGAEVLVNETGDWRATEGETGADPLVETLNDAAPEASAAEAAPGFEALPASFAPLPDWAPAPVEQASFETPRIESQQVESLPVETAAVDSQAIDIQAIDVVAVTQETVAVEPQAPEQIPEQAPEQTWADESAAASDIEQPAPVAVEAPAEAAFEPGETTSIAATETLAQAEPAPTQAELPVITAADPSKPKRSGWWARAKANLTGA